jgi:hypothetical protein
VSKCGWPDRAARQHPLCPKSRLRKRCPPAAPAIGERHELIGQGGENEAFC